MDKQVPGQLSFEDLGNIQKSVSHCGDCVCRNCLYWNSGRCPYGACYDDYRAKTDPYDKAHPNRRTSRTSWSDWNKPGEQAHWCRGGILYPVHYCKHFVKYQGCEIRDCLKSVIAVYQDGYMSCCIIDSEGCEKCYEEFLRKVE